MKFIVLKDYEPHNFKVGDIVLIDEVAWPEFVKELLSKNTIKEKN